VFFNQGESFVFTGGAAGHQQVAHISVGPDVVLGHVGTSETLATNDGPEDVVKGERPIEAPDETVLGGGPATPASDGVLPFTGTGMLLYLAIAFALISAGAWLVALHRTRVPAAS
jgi:hypothetical protein